MDGWITFLGVISICPILLNRNSQKHQGAFQICPQHSLTPSQKIWSVREQDLLLFYVLM